MDLFGKKIGIISGDRQFTYAQFGERCERLATAPVSEGLRGGRSSSVPQLQQPPVARRLLRRRAGGRYRHASQRPPVAAGVGRHPEPFRRAMPDLRERLCAAGRETPSACPAISSATSPLEHKIPVADMTYEELLAKGSPSAPTSSRSMRCRIAELFYTSGSTGTPKGVTLTHRTLYLHGSPWRASIAIETMVDLHTIPLFHANGWGRPQASTMMGVKQVMVRRFEPHAGAPADRAAPAPPTCASSPPWPTPCSTRRTPANSNLPACATS